MSDRFSIKTLSTKSFYLNDFKIDASKNTISLGDSTHTIEPKVMHVLLVLAESRGQTVCQETLFDRVWPNGIFSSGSIRRCIAILRKILIDNEAQEAITTYPKKGYCLNWIISIEKQDKDRHFSFVHWMALGMVMVIVIGLSIHFSNRSASPILVSNVIPITSSEHQEFKAKPSFRGEYIAYLRIDKGMSKARSLWIKSLITDDTFLVAEGVKSFSWSPSKQALVFVSESDSLEKIYLTSIDTLNETPRFIMDITQGKRVGTLHFGKGKLLYALIKNDSNISFRVFDLDTKLSKVIKEFDASFAPYEVAVQTQGDAVAFAGFNSKGVTQLKYLALNSSKEAGSELELIASLANNRYFLNWRPNGRALLVSDGKALSEVNLNGEVARVGYESYQFLQHPVYLPDESGIIVSQARLDADIGVANLNSSQVFGPEDVKKVIDSNAADTRFSLSPDRRSLAFISNRKGYAQVYLYHFESGKTQIVFANPKRMLGLSRPIWSNKGDKLALSNYDVPLVISLEGNILVEEFTHSLGVVKDWVNDDSALVIQDRGNTGVSQFNLVTQQVKTLNNEANWRFPSVHTSKLFAFLQSAIYEFEGDKVTQLYDFKLPVHAAKRIDQRLYITLKNKQQAKLVEFDLVTRKVTQELSIPVTWSAATLLNDAQVLIESETREKDIILLQLK